VAWLGGHTPEQVLCQLPLLQVTAVLAIASCGVDIADMEGVTHVRETMGLADVMAAMWSECDDASGMHFNAAKYVIVELIDPATSARVPWADGARGEAVYTTFDRDATPVLRYRSTDLVEVTGVRCACGRTSPKVRPLGRAGDGLKHEAASVSHIRSGHRLRARA
jgi:phenylacetate-CoA ligase/benzoylacetate-CoA ligase